MTLKLSVLDQSPICEGGSAAQALQASLDLAILADQLGYSRYWVAEHHALNSLASPAPEILLARVGAATSRIRLGSGGVMLPHYSPLKVAEVFTMLNALYPNRIDLGVGRAPGGGPLESFALRRDRAERPMADDFNEQLAELLAYFDQNFPADHPFKRIKMSCDTPDGSIVWLLGSSMWSASAAAHMGLPYAFAHFFSGEETRAAITHYQTRFVASKYRSKPEATIAVGVICADTMSEAERLASSIRLMRRRLRSAAGLGPLASPETALRELAATSVPWQEPTTEWPAQIIGTPARVGAALREMARALRLDEISIVTIIFDPAARLRSYELLARAFELNPAAKAS